MFAKGLESHTQRDLIILFNFALFVSAEFVFTQPKHVDDRAGHSMFDQLFNWIISNSKNQPFADYASRHSSSQDAKHDLKNFARFTDTLCRSFYYCLSFSHVCRLLWAYSNQNAKRHLQALVTRMSPGDIAELSQSSALAFRIVGEYEQLPPRSKLYWRAMVLDEYDGPTWTSNFSNQQPVQAAQSTARACRFSVSIHCS